MTKILSLLRERERKGKKEFEAFCRVEIFYTRHDSINKIFIESFDGNDADACYSELAECHREPKRVKLGSSIQWREAFLADVDESASNFLTNLMLG